MTRDTDRMIADAKRAARRLARTCAEGYQECLDMTARRAGRAHWGAYLADPVDVRALSGDGAEDRGTDDAPPPLSISAPADVPLVVYDPRPPIAPLTFRTIGAAGGEGIMLGVDGSRVVRSSRRATVLCVGEPGSGKTMGIVLPTIAMASEASQIIHDPKPELLVAVLSLGVRSHTRVLSLDLLAEATPPDVERAAFNPLHPAFGTPGDEWAHALRIANTLIPPDAYGIPDFTIRGRLVLAALATYLMVRPDRIPAPDGQVRIASLPGLVDWMIQAFHGGIEHSLHQVAQDCHDDARLIPAFEQLASLASMTASDRAGILGAVDKAMLPIRNVQVRQILDPRNADDGATIVHALEDRTRASTVFVVANQRNAPATATLAALAIDLFTHWRSVQGPSARSLQIVLDEATKLPPMPNVMRMLREGAPAGTCLLVVAQRADMERARGTWAGADAREVHVDHVVNLLSRATGEDARTFAGLVGTEGRWLPSATDLQSPDQSHAVIGPDGPVNYSTPALYPRRRRG